MSPSVGRVAVPDNAGASDGISCNGRMLNIDVRTWAVIA
jgi:hypothetical protein